MSTESATLKPQYFRELRSLFYLFRMAELNCRYYRCRLDDLELYDKIFQAVIALATAASFGLLAFAAFTDVKTTAAILSLVAFLVAAVVPWIGLSRKIEDAQTKSIVWSGASQQLEIAMRFIRYAHDVDGEVSGWTKAAEEAYKRAASTLPAEKEDRKLIQRLEEQVREAFPPNYVWVAL